VALDSPLAEFEIGSGAQRGSRLVLYANRLVHQGGDSMETVPLAQLAAVRVSFERDPRKLNWAVALLLAALILTVVSGPLQSWIAALASKVGDPVRRDSLDAVLLGVFNALGSLAGTLPGVAAALAAVATALLVFFWLGVTVLALAFAATERSYAVWGRNRFLVDFAQTVAERLAARGN
jgi:hypothetical protein